MSAVWVPADSSPAKRRRFLPTNLQITSPLCSWNIQLRFEGSAPLRPLIFVWRTWRWFSFSSFPPPQKKKKNTRGEQKGRFPLAKCWIHISHLLLAGPGLDLRILRILRLRLLISAQRARPVDQACSMIETLFFFLRDYIFLNDLSRGIKRDPKTTQDPEPHGFMGCLVVCFVLPVRDLAMRAGCPNPGWKP